MNTIKRFITVSAIYFIGNILSKLVAFFLLPLYTAYIIPAQYGEYDLVLTLINLVSPVAFFQIWDGMFRFSFDSKELSDKYSVINNSFVISLFGIVFYFVFFLSIYHFYKFEYLWDALLYGLLFSFQYVFSFAARIFLKNSLFVFSGVANTLVTALVNIVLIVKYGWDVRSLYVAASIGCIVQILIIEFNLKLIKNFKLLDVDKLLCRKMLSFSIPLCVATVSYWLLSGFTKISIVNNLGASDNGLYAVAIRFASMITLLVSVFQYAFNEVVYLMADDIGRKEKYSLSVTLLFKTIIFGSVVICALLKWLFPVLVDAQYGDSFLLIPISIIGVSFNSVAGFLGTIFMAEKKTSHILYTTTIVAGINIFLCASTIKIVGLVGALSVLSISFLLLMVMRLLLLTGKFEVSFDYKLFFWGVLYFGAFAIFFFKTPWYVDALLALVSILFFILSTKEIVIKYIKR